VNDSNARNIAVDILDETNRKDLRLNAVRDKIFSRQQLSRQVRAEVTNLIQQTTRWQGRLDYWLRSVSDRPLRKLQSRLLIILRLATYELLIDRINPDYAIIHSYVDLAGKRVGQRVKGLTNAILRKIAKTDPLAGPDDDATSELLASWNSIPNWLWVKWETRFGVAETQALCEYQNRIPALSIRRNATNISVKELIETLAAADLKIEPRPDSDLFFSITGRSLALFQHDLFRNGSVSVQDWAAGSVVDILDPQPGETILDLCAAPGTKTVYLAERTAGDPGSKIIACDSDPERIAKAMEDVKRHGFSKIIWKNCDVSTADLPLADAVLVDAPCTGTGVIRRKPDIKWRRSPGNIAEMVEIQSKILANAGRAVKSGGRLIYSTCSLEPEENWNVVESYLKFNPRFSIDKLDSLIPKEWITPNNTMETIPHRQGVDGIFAARLIAE